MAPELGLDLKLTASKIVSTFSKDASPSIDSHDRKIAKLQQYFANLEEERRKIEVFKRELPLCMFLLNEVIEGVKAELNQSRNQKPRVLEEFMPIKSKSEEEEEEGVKSEEKESKDKMMNWMSSAQLWSDKYSNEEDDDDRTKSTNENDDIIQENDESDHRQESSDTVSFESKSRNFGGAFVPFNRDLPKKEDKVTADLPDLALVVPPRPRSVSTLAAVVSSAKPIARCQVSPPASSHVSLQSAQQQAATRKARRCWSPELHRRFVVALQQLGGAQVATPKQIRELMKVDGLTNDEVKSHLQKYRLHTRRAPHSSSSSQSVVVLGGLWVPPLEHYSASQSLQSASQSGSPQGPLQLTGSSRAVSVTVGDSCEEDGKSESYSWK